MTGNGKCANLPTFASQDEAATRIGQPKNKEANLPVSQDEAAERPRIDPRLALLARAAAKLFLVEAGIQDLDCAFAELVPAIRENVAPPCLCEREILERISRPVRYRRADR